MGLLVVICGVLLWWWWSRANESKPPQSRGTERPPEVAPTLPPATMRTAPAEQQQILLIEPDASLVSRRKDCCDLCQSARPLRFATRRLNICQWCVSLLMQESPIDVRLLHRAVLSCCPKGMPQHQFLATTFDGSTHVRRIDRMATAIGAQSPARGHGRDWMRLLRAYHLGVLGEQVSARPWPVVWDPLAASVRREDGHRCVKCGVRKTRLDVHHIIHLRRFGTNHPRNLVTLCYEQCHRAQHPHDFCLMEPLERLETSPENDRQ